MPEAKLKDWSDALIGHRSYAGSLHAVIVWTRYDPSWGCQSVKFNLTLMRGIKNCTRISLVILRVKALLLKMNWSVEQARLYLGMWRVDSVSSSLFARDQHARTHTYTTLPEHLFIQRWTAGPETYKNETPTVSDHACRVVFSCL